MPALNKSARGRLDCSMYRTLKGYSVAARNDRYLSANCIAGKAGATDLNSSQTGYVLNPVDNPFNVVSGATIDTTADGSVAIYGASAKWPFGRWRITAA